MFPLHFASTNRLTLFTIRKAPRDTVSWGLLPETTITDADACWKLFVLHTTSIGSDSVEPESTMENSPPAEIVSDAPTAAIEEVNCSCWRITRAALVREKNTFAT